MAGDDAAGILDPETALEQGFEQVAGLAEDADDYGRYQCIRQAQLRKEGELCQQGAADAAAQAAQGALDAFLGADQRIEAVPADGAAGVVGGGIIRHHDQHDDQQPLPAIGRPMQHDQVHQQKGYVEESQNNVGNLAGCSGYVLDAEEEQKGKCQKEPAEGGQGQPLPPAERNEDQQGAAKGGRPDFNNALRQGHAVELVYSDEAENGQQAGKRQGAAFGDGQDDNRQKDESGNQTFDD